jgi:hypothetical protein
MAFLRTCVASMLLVPALTSVTVNAAEKNIPGVTPVSLVNQTIPTYGVVNQVPYYSESRAQPLYLEIHRVLAEVEGRIMSGAPVVPPPPVDPKAKKEKPDEQKAPQAAPLQFGDARLAGLLQQLVELDARLIYRTYAEQWHIDNSFANLSRAAELQAMSGYVTPDTAAAVETARKNAAEQKAAAQQAAKAAAQAAEAERATRIAAQKEKEAARKEAAEKSAAEQAAALKAALEKANAERAQSEPATGAPEIDAAPEVAVPADVPAEVPPADAPAEPPVEAPPADVPAEVPPADAPPTEAPAEAPPADAPAEAPPADGPAPEVQAPPEAQ